MFHFLSLRPLRPRIGTLMPPVRAPIPSCIAFPFLAGLAAGCVIGLFSCGPQEYLISVGLISADVCGGTFPAALWKAFRFVLIAAFFGTGILGLILIPLLSAVRAFTLACSIGVILQQRSASSIALALCSFGIPALLSLPAFFLAAGDSFVCSRHLLIHDGGSLTQEIPFLTHAAAVLLLCVAEAVVSCWILPHLIALIS